VLEKVFEVIISGNIREKLIIAYKPDNHDPLIVRGEPGNKANT